MKTFILQYYGIGQWFDFIDDGQYPIEFLTFAQASYMARFIADIIQRGQAKYTTLPHELKFWRIVDSTGKNFP